MIMYIKKPIDILHEMRKNDYIAYFTTQYQEIHYKKFP